MIEFGMQSAVGTRHEVNEDTMGHSLPHGLWLLADGMGGHAAGDVASATVRDRIIQAVEEGADLPAAIQQAHQAVLATAEQDAARRGMGSTVVAVQIDALTARVAWVGDSRLYLLRAGELRQVTRDHSLVQWLMQRGDIDATQAQHHPDRHVLVRTLGFEHPAADVTHIELQPGDRLLLCSDGVSGELGDQEMRDLVAANSEPQAAADALVAAVEAREGKDDASVIVIRIGEAQRGHSGGHDGLAFRRWWPAVAGVGAGLLIFLIWNWMKSS
jgi:PPM family protein phosphatase